MNIDPTIYGYVGEGFICCPSCAEKIAQDERRAFLAEEGSNDDLAFEADEPASHDDYEAADLRPLHSSDDTSPCGETCECGNVVFEESDDHGIGEACRYCGYLVLSTWAVVTDDHRRIVLARFQTEGEAEDDVWERQHDGVDEGPWRIIETPGEEPGVGGVIPLPGQYVLAL